MVTGKEGRRRRHNAAERQAVLERLAASDRSLSAFCRAELVSQATLHRWKSQTHGASRLARRAAGPSGFLDLGSLGGAITIEVELGGGVTLRVRRG